MRFRAQIYTGLGTSGFGLIGARVALEQPQEDLAAANAEWQRRRDETLRQLDGLPTVRAAGGWSLLLYVTALGLDCVEVSDRLLEKKVAVTPMRAWDGRLPIVTSASCSATSQSSGWHCSATASAGHSPPRAKRSSIGGTWRCVNLRDERPVARPWQTPPLVSAYPSCLLTRVQAPGSRSEGWTAAGCAGVVRPR
jgi:hypothetical protein